jgi:hypothetical protein
VSLESDLRRARGCEMTPVHYFAFGANMSSAVLRRRRIEVLSREPARLRGYRLVFDLAGFPWVEPAFASIVRHPEHDVYGVLYQLTPEQLDRVDSYEGRAYSVIEVDVEGARSGTKRSRTYQTKRPTPSLRPSRRYLRVICGGARENDLPPSYLRGLGAHPSVYVPVLSEIVERGIGLFEAANRFFCQMRAR